MKATRYEYATGLVPLRPDDLRRFTALCDLIEEHLSEPDGYVIDLRPTWGGGGYGDGAIISFMTTVYPRYYAEKGITKELVEAAGYGVVQDVEQYLRQKLLYLVANHKELEESQDEG